MLFLAFSESGDSYLHGYWALVELFWAGALLAIGMILLVVPVLAATSVVGERRRGTLMPVQLSLLRPFDIVWGKVVASIAPILFPVVVCVVTFLPFSLWVNMDVERVYRLFVIVVVGVALVALSVVVSVVCVLCSTFAKSSAAAIVMSCGLFCSMIFIMPLAGYVLATEILLDVGEEDDEIAFGLSLLVCMVGGLPSCFLWACRRLRLPAKQY